MGKEIMQPRKEMLEIHLEERRGSRVSVAEVQYLNDPSRRINLNSEQSKRPLERTRPQAQDKPPES